MSILSGFFGSAPTMKVTWDNQDTLPTVRVGGGGEINEDRILGSSSGSSGGGIGSVGGVGGVGVGGGSGIGSGSSGIGSSGGIGSGSGLSGGSGMENQVYLFAAEQNISGTVEVILAANMRKLEHNGIKAELIGQIELINDRGNHHVFLSAQQELSGPGILTKDISYHFDFKSKEHDKQYESYDGIHVRLRYFVRVRILRGYSPVSKEFDFYIQKVQPQPEVNNSLKMEVGVEDFLHIEFEYDKSKYHLKDVISGKIYFVLVKIRIKHMELQILKRETVGTTGPNLHTETDVITKFEIMDGAPIKGENVPIRIFLEPYELTPTKTVINKFSVKYYLNLVLVDEEERKYFKQQEIQLWRKELKHSHNLKHT